MKPEDYRKELELRGMSKPTVKPVGPMAVGGRNPAWNDPLAGADIARAVGNEPIAEPSKAPPLPVNGMAAIPEKATDAARETSIFSRLQKAEEEGRGIGKAAATIAGVGEEIRNLWNAATEYGKLPVSQRESKSPMDFLIKPAGASEQIGAPTSERMAGATTLTQMPEAGAMRVGEPSGPTRYVVPGAGTMEGIRLGGVTSPQNSLGVTSEAFNVGGPGTFTVQTGPRGGLSDAEWNSLSQDDRTRIRVAALNQQAQTENELGAIREAAAYQKAQRFGQPAPLTRRAAGVLNELQGGGPSPGMENPGNFARWAAEGATQPAGGYTGPGGSWQPAEVQQRNERITQQNAIDDARVAAKNFIASQAPGRDRRAAIAAVGDVFSAQNLGKGLPQAKFSDLIAAQRLGLDAQRFGLEQQRAGLATEMEQAKYLQEERKQADLQAQRSFENTMSTAKNEQGRVQTATEAAQAAAQTLAVPGFESTLYEFALRDGVAPQLAAAYINEAISSNEEYGDIFSSNDAELKQKAIAQVQALVRQRLGL